MKLKAVSSAGSRVRAAFSLIELLVVIAIIAILAGLLLTTSGYIQEKAGNARAQAEIKAMESALENYKQDFGSYPEGDGSDKSTLTLLDKLNPKDKGEKVYFEVPPKMMDTYRSNLTAQEIRSTAKQLVDPFGNPYYYYFDANKGDMKSGKGFFDLWSQGKKGSANAGKPDLWIKNW